VKNQKGFTLIEILATVTMLSILTITVIYVLQQSTVFSKQTNDKENHVLVTRTVMEQIKANLKDGNAIELYGKSVSLAQLKQSQSVSLPSLLLPIDSQPKTRVDIHTLLIPNDAVSVKEHAYHVSDYFRLVEVTTTELSTNRSYSLQAYVEYN
jgi:prepilin-type N-terminal cleavage/methylation domain-containing protein